MSKIVKFYVIETEPKTDFCSETFDTKKEAIEFIKQNGSENIDHLSFYIKEVYITL